MTYWKNAWWFDALDIFCNPKRTHSLNPNSVSASAVPQGSLTVGDATPWLTADYQENISRGLDFCTWQIRKIKEDEHELEVWMFAGGHTSSLAELSVANPRLELGGEVNSGKLRVKFWGEWEVPRHSNLLSQKQAPGPQGCVCVGCVGRVLGGGGVHTGGKEFPDCRHSNMTAGVTNFHVAMSLAELPRLVAQDTVFASNHRLRTRYTTSQKPEKESLMRKHG